MPRVSVIIPTYNCAPYVGAAVESVLAQTWQDFELIVVDDGSTDNTRSILERYLDRIVYLHQENQGESVARNRGIEIARGEYIAFLDSDDLWQPTKLERQVANLKAHPEAVLAYSYSYAIDASGEPICFRGSNRIGAGEDGLHQVFEQLIMGNVVANINTVLLRRQSLLGMTAFDPAIEWGEDWDLWLRLSLAGPFGFVPEPLACYRMRKPGRRLQIEASDEFVRQSEMILEKAFSTVPNDRADLARLRPRAFAALYLRSAMYNFELGDTARVRTTSRKPHMPIRIYLDDRESLVSGFQRGFPDLRREGEFDGGPGIHQPGLRQSCEAGEQPAILSTPGAGGISHGGGILRVRGGQAQHGSVSAYSDSGRQVSTKYSQSRSHLHRRAGLARSQTLGSLKPLFTTTTRRSQECLHDLTVGKTYA